MITQPNVADHDPNPKVPNEKTEATGGLFVSPTESNRPYSIFTTKEKWFIVCLTSFAGLFRQEYVLPYRGDGLSVMIVR